MFAYICKIYGCETLECDCGDTFLVKEKMIKFNLFLLRIILIFPG